MNGVCYICKGQDEDIIILQDEDRKYYMQICHKCVKEYTMINKGEN